MKALQSKHVDTLYIMGLATDYRCRGVNQSINDSKDAIREMEQAGAILTVSADIQ